MKYLKLFFSSDFFTGGSIAKEDSKTNERAYYEFNKQYANMLSGSAYRHYPATAIESNTFRQFSANRSEVNANRNVKPLLN